MRPKSGIFTFLQVSHLLSWSQLLRTILLLALTLQCAPLHFGNPNDPSSNNWMRLNILGCMLGSNTMLCPRTNITGSIITSRNSPLHKAKIVFTPAGQSEQVLQSDEAGGFSTLLPGTSYEVSVIGFNGVPLGKFSLGVNANGKPEAIGVSPGITVGSVLNGNTTGITIRIEETSWMSFFGGATSETAGFVEQVMDGGYVIAGMANGSFTLGSKQPIQGYLGNQDIVAIKVDKNGQLEWYTFIGSATGMETISSFSKTLDGGCIIAGKGNATITSLSGKSPVLGYSGGSFDDAFVVKLGPTGLVDWYSFFGESSFNQEALSVITTIDSGYLISGYSSGGITTLGGKAPGFGPTGTNDQFMIIKVSSIGQIEWFDLIGGTGAARATSAIQYDSGDYVVIGSSNTGLGSVGTPIHQYQGTSQNILTLKLSPTGKIKWFTFFGDSGAGSITPYSTSLTSDGSIYVTGYSSVPIGNFYGMTPVYSGGGGLFNMLVLKINPNGTLGWYTFFYSGTANDSPLKISTTPNDGFLLTGYSGNFPSIAGKTPFNTHTAASQDCFVMKFTKQITLDWYTFFGSSLGNGDCRTITMTNDGGFVVSGDVAGPFTLPGKTPTFNHFGGVDDLFTVKLNSSGK